MVAVNVWMLKPEVNVWKRSEISESPQVCQEKVVIGFQDCKKQCPASACHAFSFGNIYEMSRGKKFILKEASVSYLECF